MPPSPYCYQYPRPAVTVDLAVFALEGEEIRVLLIRRKHDPFEGAWALPGGFLEMDEAIEAGARRELREETGFDATGPVEFLGVYGDPGRDPRGRTISFLHAATIRGGPSLVKGGDDASEAAWMPPLRTAPLAFDHASMLEKALGWLAEGVRSGTLGLSLLPDQFEKADAARMLRATGGTGTGPSRWIARLERGGLIRKVDGGYERVAS